LIPSPEHRVLRLFSLKLQSRKMSLFVAQVGTSIHKIRNSALLKNSLRSSICTHTRNVLLLRNLHIQSSCCRCVQLARLPSHCTKHVTHVKLSNCVLTSKFVNINQMLICLILSMHFCLLQVYTKVSLYPSFYMDPRSG
jgi:hypothetical protein